MEMDKPLLYPEQEDLLWIRGHKAGVTLYIAGEALHVEERVSVQIGDDELVLHWLLDRVGQGRVRRDAKRDHNYLRIERLNGDNLDQFRSHVTVFEKDGLWLISREGFYRSWELDLPSEETWENAFRSFGISCNFPVEEVASIDVVAGPLFGSLRTNKNPWFGDGRQVPHGRDQLRYLGGTFACLWESPVGSVFGTKILRAFITPPVSIGRLRKEISRGAGINN